MYSLTTTRCRTRQVLHNVLRHLGTFTTCRYFIVVRTLSRGWAGGIETKAFPLLPLYKLLNEKRRVPPRLTRYSVHFFPSFHCLKRSLRRLCFHRCLSVNRTGWCLPLIPWGVCHPPPPADPTWANIPSSSSTCWDTVNKRAVRTPWNAFLFVLILK